MIFHRSFPLSIIGHQKQSSTFPAAVQHALGFNGSSTAALFCVTLCKCAIVSPKTASLESLTRKTGRYPHHPFTTLFRSRMQANVEAATSSLSAPIRMADSALSNHPQPPPKPRTLQCIPQLFHMEPLAAFSNNMSEQQAVAFDDYIDWSKVDLLDACLDPSLVGMGPDR
jgi:hypothetical protein